jgi:hypothetical protein
MTNSILHLELHDGSRLPPEAEVRLTVVPRFLDTGTEVRGRLMGPRNHFASTIEVAYHFRPWLVPTTQPALTLRALIPEASFWEPQCPHLYAGPIELWQDGQRCQVVQVRHGLRRLALGPRGLRLGGRPLRLRGVEVEALDELAALALRQAGFNLVVVPMSEATLPAWEIADRIGLFILGRLREGAPAPDALLAHPACLGWLASGEQAPPQPAGAFLGHVRPGGTGYQFRAVRPDELAAAGPDLPLLVLDTPPGFDSAAAVLGVVQRQ